MPAPAALPAGQEVAPGAGVHGGGCQRAPALPAAVEQRWPPQPGVQLLHPPGLPTARVPQPDLPPDPAALLTPGTFTVTSRAFSRRFYQKRLTFSIFVRRKRKNISLSVQ